MTPKKGGTTNSALFQCEESTLAGTSIQTIKLSLKIDEQELPNFKQIFLGESLYDMGAIVEVYFMDAL